MFGIPSIYSYFAGGVLALALAGTISYQNGQIHNYHTKYNCVNYGIDCDPKHPVVTVPDLQTKINSMTTAQDNQRKTSQDNVEKVVNVEPKIVVDLKNFKQQPNPVDCKTPEIPAELESYL